MVRPFGVDIGNAVLNLVGPTGTSRIAMPHALAAADDVVREAAMVPASGDPIKNLHARISSPLVGQAGGVYIAGELATREYPDLVTERDEGEIKARSQRHHLLMLMALAAAAQNAYPVDQTARMALSVALPLVEARQAENRRLIQQALVGRHDVTWLSTPRWAGRRTVLDIVDVDVVPEAAAAFFALSARHPEVIQQTVMVVDIGAGSVDWSVQAPGGQFQLGLSDGTQEGGVAVAADRIRAAAQAQYGPHAARHRTDVLNALRTASTSGSNQVLLPVDVGYKDVSKEAQEALAALAKTIALHVRGAVRKAGHVDRIFLVGGGGALLHSYLQQASELPFELVGEPEWANAEGLFLRAQNRIARSVVQ